MQSNESLGVLRLIFPSARAGRRPVIGWKHLVGHGPCHTFIESCPQGVLRTVRVLGLSDQRPSLIVAHGLLFGSFLPNRSPWASIWQKHCYDVLERNCQIKSHGLVFRKHWYWRYVTKWSIKIIVGKIIAIQVVKKHRTSNTLQILLSDYFLVHQT